MTGMKQCAVMLAVLAVSACSNWVKADSTLAYTGDFDGNSAGYNVIDGLGGSAIIYNDFVVPTGQTWVVTSVFSNDFMNWTPSSLTAQWSILSSVSSGNGGSVVASDTGAATQTANGTSLNGLNGYTVTVSGLNVTLGAGTYWLAVSPVDGSGTYESFVATTSGTNAIGMTGDDTYLSGSYYINLFGSDFVPAFYYVTNPSGGNPVFSMGLAGSAVPEPSTLALGTIGALGLLGYVWTRRRVGGC